MKEFAPENLWVDDADIGKLVTRGVISAFQEPYRGEPEYSTQYTRSDKVAKLRARLLEGSDGVGGDWTTDEIIELFKEIDSGTKNF